MHTPRDISEALMLHDQFVVLDRLFYSKMSQISKPDLDQAITHAWEAIDQYTMDSLILSVPQYIAAVRKARGYHTKY